MVTRIHNEDNPHLLGNPRVCSQSLWFCQSAVFLQPTKCGSSWEKGVRCDKRKHGRKGDLRRRPLLLRYSVKVSWNCQITKGKRNFISIPLECDGPARLRNVIYVVFSLKTGCVPHHWSPESLYPKQQPSLMALLTYPPKLRSRAVSFVPVIPR